MLADNNEYNENNENNRPELSSLVPNTYAQIVIANLPALMRIHLCVFTNFYSSPGNFIVANTLRKYFQEEIGIILPEFTLCAILHFLFDRDPFLTGAKVQFHPELGQMGVANLALYSDDVKSSFHIPPTPSQPPTTTDLRSVILPDFNLEINQNGNIASDQKSDGLSESEESFEIFSDQAEAAPN